AAKQRSSSTLLDHYLKPSSGSDRWQCSRSCDAGRVASHRSGESSKRCFQWLGKLPKALSSHCPGKTYAPTSTVRRRSRYSTTGKPTGRMDSPSLLSSNRKQLASMSASVHFRPI